ncbi:MAG: polysaccharide deacetylase family protein [Candidatus Jettenia sp. CY-1]|nr:polysaccharide deacetylase family protein [Candidatus Jettenia sp.]WKZ20388.1 MAG: polysaccharide deacetylase family protein [Candidatus Jettenia sp. CY-1]
MMISRINKLLQTARRLKKLFDRKILILHYHRITEEHSDPCSLCITPQNFSDHLEILQKYARPIQLQQLIKAFHNKSLPHKSVAITFDDDYADNLHNAKLLLECHNIPATMFLTTGYIGKMCDFWWEELDNLLLQPDMLSKTLRLSMNKNISQWESSKAVQSYHEDYWHYRRWTNWEKDDPCARYVIYLSLYELLHHLSEEEQQEAIDKLLLWINVRSTDTDQQTPDSLSFEDVYALAQGKLIEIGAHTVTHPILSTLPLATQRKEILQSKAYLEEILSRPITSFAYPYGRECDYTEETVTLVQEAGFNCACTNASGIIGRDTNCFQLPRIQIYNWNGEEFSRQLSRWFNFQ